MPVSADDAWVIEKLDEIRSHYGFKSDSELAKFLGTTRTMIAQARGGHSRLPVKVRLTVADKIGFLRTAKGFAWALEQVAPEASEKLLEAHRALIQSQVGKVEE